MCRHHRSPTPSAGDLRWWEGTDGLRNVACSRRHFMDRGDIAIATMTWARSPADEDLLIRSLGSLIRTGVPVIVTDRGTNASFLRRLRGMSCTVEVAAHETLVGQVQQSVAAAAALGTRFICYTEPDKEQFFDDRLLDFLSRAPGGQDVGVVLAGRSPDS